MHHPVFVTLRQGLIVLAAAAAAAAKERVSSFSTPYQPPAGQELPILKKKAFTERSVRPRFFDPANVK
eukprot:838112-Rhodomonas_salina.2